MARSLAADERWRVREGVVIGLQLLGERSFGALTATVSRWVDDQDPLVQRAAVAAICEPRLLRSPEAAGQAVAMCQRATRHLVEVPRGERARPGVRVLRQALGYCWSVAVAASPVTGLPVFAGLDVSDPDVAWLVKENSRKKRLAALL